MSTVNLGFVVVADQPLALSLREAVESGLVSPCIMCLTMPQSNVDHFCGRACREGALSKPF